MSGKILIFLTLIFVLTTGCEHSTENNSKISTPKIISIDAPEIVELPKTIFPECKVKNSDGIDLQYKWEATAGTISNTDSSVLTFYTPKVKSEVTITCIISDSGHIYDQKSKTIFIELPPFVGSYKLLSIYACDSTYNSKPDRYPELLLDIHESLISQWAFPYSWRVAGSGLPVPDSCVFSYDLKTHMGIVGKHGPDEDQQLWLAHPHTQGYITLIYQWSKQGDTLILAQGNIKYTFLETE